MMRTIVLVGFPGSGKSTVGKKLSLRLSLPFYDMDSYFSKKYHVSIPDFFSKYGEDFFRICENSVLKELLSFPPCVIATGGGTPCFFDSMALINESALSLYIELSQKSLVDRLLHSKKTRPLVNGKTTEELITYVGETLAKREPFYRQAQVCVKGENLQMAELLAVVYPFFESSIKENYVAPPGIEPEFKV